MSLIFKSFFNLVHVRQSKAGIEHIFPPNYDDKLVEFLLLQGTIFLQNVFLTKHILTQEIEWHFCCHFFFCFSRFQTKPQLQLSNWYRYLANNSAFTFNQNKFPVYTYLHSILVLPLRLCSFLFCCFYTHYSISLP
jgi:hypothetical protein